MCEAMTHNIKKKAKNRGKVEKKEMKKGKLNNKKKIINKYFLIERQPDQCESCVRLVGVRKMQ